jgi:hypothetical protein
MPAVAREFGGSESRSRNGGHSREKRAGAG